MLAKLNAYDNLNTYVARNKSFNLTAYVSALVITVILPTIHFRACN